MKRVFAITAILIALFSAPQSALANTLVSTSPTAGQSLESAPSAVTITTEAPVMSDGNEVIVTDPSGIRVDDGSLTIAENSTAPEASKIKKEMASDDIPIKTDSHQENRSRERTETPSQMFENENDSFYIFPMDTSF